MQKDAADSSEFELTNGIETNQFHLNYPYSRAGSLLNYLCTPHIDCSLNIDGDCCSEKSSKLIQTSMFCEGHCDTG